MRKLSRRRVIGDSLGLAAAGIVARPFLAKAAVKTASVWWTQGFVPEEDAAFRAMVADYEKQSGNTIDYSLIPFAPLMQKVISSLTSGDVPDVISHDIQDQQVVPQNAWNDRLLDLSDIVEPLKSQLHSTAYLGSRFYNNVTKQRAAYQAPYKTQVLPFHVWGSLVEKAGLKLADAPKTWDAFWDYFKPAQEKLRGQGMRGVYSLGLQPTTNGPADGNQMFTYFLAAHHGMGIVTPDGRPHLDEPAVKEAVIKAITYITTAYKQGYVPPGALDWSDADDNNAFHAKTIVMDLDGTISTEVAIFNKKEDYDDIVTMGLALSNDGKPVPSSAGVGCGLVPKGAKNVAVAKDFLKYLIQPKICNEYLKVGLGRSTPCMPSIVKTDHWWFDDPHRAPYTQQALLDPTLPQFWVFNPAYAQVQAEHVWSAGWVDIMKEGVAPQMAAEKAFKRIEEIFAKYPIASS